MALQPGTRLGLYEITSQIGESAHTLLAYATYLEY